MGYSVRYVTICRCKYRNRFNKKQALTAVTGVGLILNCALFYIWNLQKGGLLEQHPTAIPVWQHPAYAHRRQHSEDVCSSLRGGQVMSLTGYGNTSYCIVPKVGCTFWINIFRFLHGDTGNNSYSSPFHIPRIFTHYGATNNMMFYKINSTFAPQHLARNLRFMFVRDPYSRLWSAYVDKFLLLDFWPTEGQHIVKLRKEKNNNMIKCANDISFQEFLDYVTTRKDKKTLNSHWRPIQYLCSPCEYRPHVIGKMETFSQDSRYILSLMNISWILDACDPQQHVYHEMDMLIEYNFQVMKDHKHYVNCTNATDLSRRLWKTFQINGYLPLDQGFPDLDPTDTNGTQLRMLAHRAHKKGISRRPDDWKRQRQQALKDAFKDVSPESRRMLRKIYREDFELFGYDPNPVSLLGNS